MKAVIRWLVKNYSQDESLRVLLVFQFCVTAILISLFYALIHPVVNIHVPRWVFITLPAWLAACIFALKYKVLEARKVAQLVILAFWVSFCVGIRYSGGVYSLVLPWLALMPIMAHLLVTYRAAKIWFGVVLASVLFFNAYFNEPGLLIDAGAPWRSTFSVVGLITIIFFFTHLFYKANLKMITEVRLKNEVLMEQKEEIESQNESLVHQKNEIQAQNEFISKQNSLLTRQKNEIQFVNDELRKRVSDFFDRNEKLEKHWHTLLDISKSRAINFGDFEEGMRHLTQVAAENLETNRVSVWAFNEERNSIRCLVLYKRDTKQHVTEEELLLTQFPRYFEALKLEEVISADEARYNPKTFEFKQAYLEPRQILSMMDTPYFIDGQLAGVLCCEQTSEQRHWTPEDILFAQALSDMITLCYRANQRRDYERSIRQHRKEIVRVNESLEERVKQRTEELEEQNKRLAEYAYINSHLLRGPLSRILGLINLIEYSENRTEKEKLLVDHLRKSGEELDEVVKKINEAIVDGSGLDRNRLSEGK